MFSVWVGYDFWLLWHLKVAIVAIELIWEKWKLTFVSVSTRIFGKVLQKCLLSSPLCFIRLLSILLNLIVCQGFMLKKIKKKHLLLNHKVEEADTVHT